MKFEIVNNLDSSIEILGALQLESNDFAFIEFDSIIFSQETYRGLTKCHGNSCITNSYGFKKYQKLIIYTKDKNFETPVFKRPNWANPTFKIIISRNSIEVIEKTSVYIKASLIEIIISIAITILFELLFAIFIVFKKFKKLFKYIVLVNIISVPTIWIVYRIFGYFLPWNLYSIIIAETLIILFEYFLYRKLISNVINNQNILILSVVGNIISFIIGLIIFAIAFLNGIY